MMNMLINLQVLLFSFVLLFSYSETFAGSCSSKGMSEMSQPAPKSVQEVFGIKDLNSTIQTFLNPREVVSTYPIINNYNLLIFIIYKVFVISYKHNSYAHSI